MTIEEIKERIKEIEEMMGDFEAAHSKEDQLVEEVLNAIADENHPDPVGLAIAVLDVYNLEYIRYTA